MSDVRELGPYEDLRRALDVRAGGVWPSRDALSRVRATTRRRRRRRRVALGSCALVATTIAVASLGGTLREAPSPGREAAPASPQPVSEGPQALRSQYGIVGTTKGAASPDVLPRASAPGGGTPPSTGGSLRLPKDTASASQAPNRPAVAGVTTTKEVFVESATSSGSSTALLGRTKPGTQVSWSAGGTTLFAFVGGHWMRVPSAGAANPRAHAHALRVPRLPGGPSFLSVSPGRDFVVLFGVTRVRGAGGPAVRPHLFVGRFDGTEVTHVHAVRVSPAAVRGPLGWLGDNAFLLAAGPGKAWIVRVHGSHVLVRASLPDPCHSAAPATCAAGGSTLLGTDGDGDLLLWAVRSVSTATTAAASPGLRAGAAARPAITTSYFSTWLDGSHVERLAGAAARYGPALAAR